MTLKATTPTPNQTLKRRTFSNESLTTVLKSSPAGETTQEKGKSTEGTEPIDGTTMCVMCASYKHKRPAEDCCLSCKIGPLCYRCRDCCAKSKRYDKSLDASFTEENAITVICNVHLKQRGRGNCDFDEHGTPACKTDAHCLQKNSLTPREGALLKADSSIGTLRAPTQAKAILPLCKIPPNHD